VVDDGHETHLRLNRKVRIMLRWLKSLVGVPQPSGPPQSIRQFHSTEPILAGGDLAVDGDGWVVDSKENQTLRLFEVAGLELEQCLLTYRAQMKTEALAGRAFLEMWCRLPGRGEFFSKGVQQAVSGTTDWAWHEVPFRLSKGQAPDLIKLNLVVEGQGRVWLKAVELLKTPLAS
jgi:hypothetical protein